MRCNNRNIKLIGQNQVVANHRFILLTSCALKLNKETIRPSCFHLLSHGQGFFAFACKTQLSKNALRAA